MAPPDEIAIAAGYLLGPDAGFVTGSDLLIDGGVVAAMRAGKLPTPGRAEPVPAAEDRPAPLDARRPGAVAKVSAPAKSAPPRPRQRTVRQAPAAPGAQ